MSVTRAHQPLKAPSPNFASIIHEIQAESSLAAVSRRRVTDLLGVFSNFLAVSGVQDLADIQPSHAEDFVRSLNRSGAEPSLATMHLRRTALRTLFREAMAMGLVAADPTASLVLAKRTYRDLRPLTDAEVEKCRAAASAPLGDRRFVLAWALAEATARVPELGRVRASDCDPETTSVHLPGCSSAEARWARLTAWGLGQVEAVIKHGSSDHAPLLGEGSRAGAHELVAATLRRVGLSGKPGVRPNSVAAWRGELALRNGATIDEVARLLGMRSLDRTASFIGFEWRDRA